MMIPRLQMKEPYRFCYDKVHSVDVHRYMSEGGYIAGLAAAWKDYVYEMYEHFDADIAANEGIEAVIRYLMPARRRLTISKENDNCYIIGCNEGGAFVYLTLEEDDSLILSFPKSYGPVSSDSIDLGCYDSAEAASFIAQAFKAYRELNNKFWRVLNLS